MTDLSLSLSFSLNTPHYTGGVSAAIIVKTTVAARLSANTSSDIKEYTKVHHTNTNFSNSFVETETPQQLLVDMKVCTNIHDPRGGNAFMSPS